MFRRVADNGDWKNRQNLYLFVVIVEICRLFSDKQGAHNLSMEITNKYIPREYLALKINYLRQQLARLPVITLQKYFPVDDNKSRVVVNNHKYCSSTDKGKYYLRMKAIREMLEDELRVLEAIWDMNFKGEPPKDCEPIKANRVLYVDTNSPVIMNKDYFDSLKMAEDPKYPRPDNNKFNGVYYRSAAEKEIAMFYTEMGIPFVYEPDVMLKGLIKTINPDFVLYIKELDTCKFHEHFGMKDYADYISNSKLKFSNYTNAGLVQDLDILFTHSTDSTWFDPRHLSSKLNAAIYGTICMAKPEHK